MKKTKTAGVYQLDNGHFCYRLMIDRKNMKIDTTCRRDEKGNPFKTRLAASRALERKRNEVLNNQNNQKKKRKTFAEVYDLYLKNNAKSKANATIEKQKSMWNNHIEKEFGNKYIDDVSIGEINDYLNKLYAFGDDYNNYKNAYSYQYVEGFLKFFYLLINYAYSYDAIDCEKYTKMIINKATRITMPKKRQEDDDSEAEYYDNKTIKKIYNIVKDSNFEIPFLLGFTLGTRLSETFALRWSNIDWFRNEITIDAQLLYQDGVWVLDQVKTLNSKRTIYMSKELSNKLKKELKRQEKEKSKRSWRATEKVYDVRERNKEIEIVGGDFICRKENGELMTPNSIKYWKNAIKEKAGVDFHFHSLRKTHLTNLANLNTPLLEFQLRSGHKKIETAQKYYINRNALAQKITKENVDIASKIDTIEEELTEDMKILKKHFESEFIDKK